MHPKIGRLLNRMCWIWLTVCRRRGRRRDDLAQAAAPKIKIRFFFSEEKEVFTEKTILILLMLRSDTAQELEEIRSLCFPRLNSDDYPTNHNYPTSTQALSLMTQMSEQTAPILQLLERDSGGGFHRDENFSVEKQPRWTWL